MSDRRNKGEVVYSEALKGVEVEEDKFALANRMIEETAKQIKKTEGKMNEIEVFLEQAEDGREAHPELEFRLRTLKDTHIQFTSATAVDKKFCFLLMRPLRNLFISISNTSLGVW